MGQNSPKNSNNEIISWKKIKAFFTDINRLKQAFRTLLPYVIIYGILLFIVNQFNITQESVQQQFAGLGAYLVPGFILLQLTASLTPLPDLPFIATGILFFEPWAAIVLIWAGMWLGAIINFLVARKLGRSLVQKKYPQTSEWIDRFTGEYGFETVVVGRAFTFVPFDLIAYAAGISNMKLKTFALASVFSLIPIALSATLVGLAFVSGNILKSLALFAFSASIAVAMGWIARRVRKRWEKG